MLTTIDDWHNTNYFSEGFDSRYTLCHMYNSIEKLELWDWVRNNPPPKNTGYTFWDCDVIYRIMSDEDVQNDGHSGASMGLTMRIMQLISYGESEEKDLYLKKRF